MPATAASDCLSVVAPNLISHSQITICRDTTEVGCNLPGEWMPMQETERVEFVGKINALVKVLHSSFTVYFVAHKSTNPYIPKRERF